MSQYVKIQFNPWDCRSYTYHHDGEPIRAGDRVEVETDRGPQTVEVVGLADEKPPFATKPIGKIVKRAKPEPEPMRDDHFDFGEGDAK